MEKITAQRAWELTKPLRDDLFIEYLEDIYDKITRTVRLGGISCNYDCGDDYDMACRLANEVEKDGYVVRVITDFYECAYPSNRVNIGWLGETGSYHPTGSFPQPASINENNK